MPEINDRINLGTAPTLLAGGKPMALCGTCGEPLIATFEWDGAEFYCVVCESKFGFLAPKPVPWTQELQDRHDELKAQYQTARDERDRERYGAVCDRDYQWPPVTSIDDHTRAELRRQPDGRFHPYVDGRWVTTSIYEAFNTAWSVFYDEHKETADGTVGD